MTQCHDGPYDRRVVGIGGQATDKRAVDLQLIDREALQVAETGVAGAEVIDGDLHAERLQFVQHGDVLFGIVHGEALGQLHLQALSRQAGVGQCLGNGLHDVVMPKLPRRHVDRDHHRRQALQAPDLCLLAGAVQRPAADRDDQTRFFGNFYEALRLHHALARQPPAQQRLGRDHAAARDIHAWLVIQLQLIARQRITQLVLNAHARQHGATELGREELQVVASVALGAVHRRVGIAQQRIGRIAVAGIERHAPAAGNVKFAAPVQPRLGDGVLHALQGT